VIATLRKHLARRRVERLIRDGVGVQEFSWEVPASTSTEQALVGDIQEWVCSSMANMRRPYGIDHVALALACRDETGRVMLSNSLGVVRPSSFYGAGGAERIEAFVGDMRAVPQHSRHEVVGALLSLGDLAYAMHVAA
jgi:hypothetical protein